MLSTCPFPPFLGFFRHFAPFPSLSSVLVVLFCSPKSVMICEHGTLVCQNGRLCLVLSLFTLCSLHTLSLSISLSLSTPLEKKIHSTRTTGKEQRKKGDVHARTASLTMETRMWLGGQKGEHTCGSSEVKPLLMVLLLSCAVHTNEKRREKSGRYQCAQNTTIHTHDATIPRRYDTTQWDRTGIGANVKRTNASKCTSLSASTGIGSVGWRRVYVPMSMCGWH